MSGIAQDIHDQDASRADTRLEGLGAGRSRNRLEASRQPHRRGIARASQRRETEKLVAQMDSENATFAEPLRSAEAREAFLAFAQKRPPDFAKLAGQ